MATYLESLRDAPQFIELIDDGVLEVPPVSGTKLRLRCLDRDGDVVPTPLLLQQAIGDLHLVRDVTVEEGGGGGGSLAFTLLSHGAVVETASTKNTSSIIAVEGDFLVLFVMSTAVAATPENEANITWTPRLELDPGGITERVFYGLVGVGGFTGQITINSDGGDWGGLWHQLVRVTGADTGGVNGGNAIVQHKTVFDNSAAPLVSCVFDGLFGSPTNGALAFWIPREDDTAGALNMVPRAGWTETHQESALVPGVGHLYMVGQTRLTADTEASITAEWVDVPNYVLGCALEIKKAA